MEAFHLGGISRPHLEVELMKLLFFMSIIEFRQPTNLFVVLFEQALFHNLVDEIKDCNNVFLSQVECLLI